MRGWQSVAPLKAIHWFERMRFVHEHPAYKFSDFDEMAAADFYGDREYHAMIAPLPEPETKPDA